MNQATQKSNFITVLSWILIIFTGFGLLGSVMQNIMIHFIFDNEEFKDFQGTTEDIIFGNFDLFVMLNGVIILYSFISSIGLLNRKNWARLSIVTLLVVGIVVLPAAMIFQWIYILDTPDDLIHPEDEIDKIFKAMKIIMLVFVVGIMGLFGWITKKLLSKKIKNEFITQANIGYATFGD